MKKGCALLLFLLFLFCVYGAVASLEPAGGGSIHTSWLVGYSVVGLGSLVAATLLLRAPS